MYKVTVFTPKDIFSAKGIPPQIEDYINEFVKEGWELVSTSWSNVGFMFVWKKK